MDFSLNKAFEQVAKRFRDVKRYVASTENKTKGEQRGGEVRLTRSFFFGARKLEINLWQGKPENTVFTQVKVPSSEEELNICAERIRHWVATGKMSNR